jgi:hypothetical protein
MLKKLGACFLLTLFVGVAILRPLFHHCDEADHPVCVETGLHSHEDNFDADGCELCKISLVKYYSIESGEFFVNHSYASDFYSFADNSLIVRAVHSGNLRGPPVSVH